MTAISDKLCHKEQPCAAHHRYIAYWGRVVINKSGTQELAT